jgi:hypothetical protein
MRETVDCESSSAVASSFSVIGLFDAFVTRVFSNPIRLHAAWLDNYSKMLGQKAGDGTMRT